VWLSRLDYLGLAGKKMVNFDHDGQEVPENVSPGFDCH